MFAAIHYVGVAGLGADAAEYADGDAATVTKRGVFGYNRVTRKVDISDGLDSTTTIAARRLRLPWRWWRSPQQRKRHSREDGGFRKRRLVTGRRDREEAKRVVTLHV
jgi:hypothetical protein